MELPMAKSTGNTPHTGGFDSTPHTSGGSSAPPGTESGAAESPYAEAIQAIMDAYGNVG
jgi:hypothetical protein